MKSLKTKYECIVIGGGLAGLTTAALLALSGIEVLIIEKNSLTGGCIFDYPVSDYTFSHTIDWMSGLHQGGMFRKFLEKLEIWDEADFFTMERFKRVVLNDYNIPFHCDNEGFFEELLHNFPHEEKGILRYQSLINSFGTPTWIDHFRSFKDAYYIDLLQQFFTDPNLISILSSNINATMPAFLMILFQVRCLHKQAYLLKNMTYTQFMQKITNRLLELGVTLLTDHEVIKINATGNQVQSVLLDDETVVHTNTMITAIDLKHVYNKLLCADPPVNDYFMNKLNSKIVCYSLISIFMGIENEFHDCLVTGEPTVYMRSNRIEDLFSPDASLWHLKANIRSQLQPFLAPAGCAAVDLRVLITREIFNPWIDDNNYRIQEAYKELKSQLAETMLDNAKRLLGDFGSKIKFMKIATPLTFQRYTHNTGGSGLGWEISPREYMNGFRITSPLSNLFHVGQWASFPGVEGVINYSFSIYPTIVKHIKKKRDA